MSNTKKTIKILSIETSCDETAISIIKASGDVSSPSFEILANETYSQIELHKEYGGVYPDLAKREHTKNLPLILGRVLEQAKMKKTSQTKIFTEKILEITNRWPEESQKSLTSLLSQIEIPEIDHIAVTQGPGLEPALWVGINFAKALSLAWSKPIIPVNHMKGHLLSVLVDSQKEENSTINLSGFEFPSMAILISGGHTELVVAHDWQSYEKIGQTLDDAIGEAFDKVGRVLELEYPGGPKISKLAKLGKENELIKLPRPMIHTKNYDFSFSGIKTAVLNLSQKLKSAKQWTDQTKADLALEFETAVTEVLIYKTKKAIEEFGVKNLIIAGGVSANKYIRSEFEKLSVPVLLPKHELATDNSVMIGIAGYFELLNKTKLYDYSKPNFFKKIFAKSNLNADDFRARANWRIDE